MSARIVRLVAVCSVFFVSACEPGGQRQDALFLPEGDPIQGQTEFVALGCAGCHGVVGAELPEPAEAGPVRVLLGSQTGRKMSYGELVTSIVNPSHRLSPRYSKDKISQDGQSLMVSYNDVMTVTQLTDLAAFLQKHYVDSGRQGYKYPVYDYQSKGEGEEEEATQ